MSRIEELAQEREIDGVNYRTQPVPFGKGLPALMRLIRLISPLLGAAFANTGAAVYAAVFDEIPKVLQDAELSYFAKLFGEAAWFSDGEKWIPLVDQNRNGHFDAEYLRFMRWLIFCMEVNFSSFFAGMKGDGKDIATLLEKFKISKESIRGNGSGGASSPTIPTPSPQES